MHNVTDDRRRTQHCTNSEQYGRLIISNNLLCVDAVASVFEMVSVPFGTVSDRVSRACSVPCRRSDTELFVRIGWLVVWKVLYSIGLWALVMSCNH